MIALSERTRIALDRLPEGTKSRFGQIVGEIDARRAARSGDRKVQGSDSWIARLDDNLRLVYRATATGVYVEDVLDRTRYPA